MSEITKEEIAIMIEVQSKSVINLEKIAFSLKATVDEQKILNTTQKKLLEEFTTGTMVTKMDNIDKIVTFNRNLFSTIGVVVIVAFVVIKALGM